MGADAAGEGMASLLGMEWMGVGLAQPLLPPSSPTLTQPPPE